VSTAARKARKRLDRWIRDERMDLPTGFQRPVKVGTPITERAAMQQRAIYEPGAQTAKRFGFTSKAKRALRARGVAIDEGNN
jgi:hypothetical protein